MAKSTNAHELFQPAAAALLEPFQLELRATDPKFLTDFIRKYITTGQPVAIDSETYYTIRRRVSQQFGVHPSSVVLVGSCKLGFALKRKGHGEHRIRYASVTPVSDVDVAVVSETLFDQIWEAVFSRVHPNRDWPLNIGRHFVRNLFNGWVAPQELPNTPTFQQAIRWAEFFAMLSRERVCGRRTINGRLYRSWSRLEAYQEHLVRECRIELARGTT